MEYHKGLEHYLSEKITDRIKLGTFSVVHNIRVSLFIEYNPVNDEYKIDAMDKYSNDTVEWHHTVFKANSLIDVATEFKNLMTYLHENVKACHHCNIPFGTTTEVDELREFGFSGKDLCSNCGLQNIYDTMFAEESCCVCLEKIGFGHWHSICGDTKHKLHYGCVREQEICPLCRCGNPDDEEYDDGDEDTTTDEDE
jgi:hypothetical protein